MAVSDLIIFGVDAADLDIITSSNVTLPTFDRLIDEGVTAELESTLPPITGAAWPAMACGRDPNSIGMFDFTNFSREEKREYRPTPDRVDPFWSYLSSEGYRVGISGYPLAPLDTPVNGFVLSWPWYLPENEQRIEPENFFSKTDIDIEEYIRSTTEFDFEIVMRDLKDKIRFDERVLQQLNFDIYYSYLDADTIIHMSTLDDLENLYEVYRTIDDGMDRMLEYCADDCSVFIVSDHGVSEVWGHFYMNQFLRDLGVLSLEKSRKEKSLRNVVRNSFAQRAKAVVKRTGLADVLRPLFDNQETRKTLGLRYEFTFALVDWDNTTVVKNGNWGQLYGLDSERTGIKEVEERLTEVAEEEGFDIELNNPAEVYRGEELHPDCPDVIVTIRKNDSIVLHSNSMGEDIRSDAQYFESSSPHLDQGEIGVFIASGPSLRNGETVDCFHLVDISPTLLNQLIGIVPPDIDGEVQHQIYQPESDLANTEPDTGFEDEYDRMVRAQVSHKASEEIKEKLGNLGYFE